jgi:hypothetical protein
MDGICNLLLRILSENDLEQSFGWQDPGVISKAHQRCRGPTEAEREFVLSQLKRLRKNHGWKSSSNVANGAGKHWSLVCPSCQLHGARRRLRSVTEVEAHEMTDRNSRKLVGKDTLMERERA